MREEAKRLLESTTDNLEPIRSFRMASQWFIGLVNVHKQQVNFLYSKHFGFIYFNLSDNILRLPFLVSDKAISKNQKDLLVKLYKTILYRFGFQIHPPNQISHRGSDSITRA